MHLVLTRGMGHKETVTQKMCIMSDAISLIELPFFLLFSLKTVLRLCYSSIASQRP